MKRAVFITVIVLTVAGFGFADLGDIGLALMPTVKTLGAVYGLAISLGTPPIWLGIVEAIFSIAYGTPGSLLLFDLVTGDAQGTTFWRMVSFWEDVSISSLFAIATIYGILRDIIQGKSEPMGPVALLVVDALWLGMTLLDLVPYSLESSGQNAGKRTAENLQDPPKQKGLGLLPGLSMSFGRSMEGSPSLCFTYTF